MIDQIFRQVAKELLNRNFIRKFGIDRKIVSEIISTVRFKDQIEKMLLEEKYDSKDVYDLMADLIDVYPVKNKPDNWLEYFYFYSLNFSFPDAVTIRLGNECNKVAEMFLRVLKIFSELQKSSNDGTWQSKYALTLLTQDEVESLEDPIEFNAFQKSFNHEYVYEMMKMNQDVIGYTTLDHICGVHHIAMKIARQLKCLGFPIDLGRVSGAAAGHDIGKFGCKPDEANRVAYYHYHYTGEWFEKRKIVYIRNVAINHSTWDLELEALPIESLILIYSDFRVKAEFKDGNSYMKIYNLHDSFKVILNKLDNLDAAKEDRYKRVYSKLRDFENFLLDLGINTEPDTGMDLAKGATIKRKYFSLMQGPEITRNVVFSSIQHNIELLYRFRDEASLNKLLEPVRSSRDMTSLRGYLAILEEYYNYLTQKQKQIVIGFLYEKLALPQEDIRKQCAELIGTIVASYDEVIRKEIPKSAVINHSSSDTLGLFDYYIDKFMNPETKVIDRHKKYISYSVRDMISSYFEHLEGKEKRLQSIECIVNYFMRYSDVDQIRFYLIKAARVLPFKEFNDEQRFKILNFVSNLLTFDDFKLRLRAYNLIYSILPYADEALIEQTAIRRVVSVDNPSTGDPAENYARLKLAENLKMDQVTIDYLKAICIDDLQYTSNIFLSNLKSATLDVAKRFQIELLMRNTLLYDYDNSFYMAMHLCNLLKVSALESVRNTAGRMLLHIIPHLNYEQKNDIAVELIRALEMESFEFTKYIPPYLGKIILHVKPKELDEIIESFEKKMSTNNEKLISLIVKTVGYAVTRYADYRYAFKERVDSHENRILRLYGVLFNGFVHSSSFVNQTAFSVVAKDVYSDSVLNLKKKEYLYKLTIKKVMSLMVNTDEANDLIFYNNSASLKYIYNFISE
ncbi:MAG: cytidyltransferase, partial [Bacillota bacterium]|nr:cytidyltransferase [Bacillota bacterium]